jgi:hypothetical protein
MRLMALLFDPPRRAPHQKFDNNKEYQMLVEPEEPAPFPDIPAKVPGMLTEHKEEFGVDDVVQEETMREQCWQQKTLD